MRVDVVVCVKVYGIVVVCPLIVAFSPYRYPTNPPKITTVITRMPIRILTTFEAIIPSKNTEQNI